MLKWDTLCVIVSYRERDARSAVRDGRDLVHLEPDGAVAGPARDVGACGGARHVHVHDARVVDRAVAHDAHLLASFDGSCRRSAWLSRIIAADIRTRDVRHWRLCVKVVRHAHIHPLWGSRAIDDERAESV